jgi:hypothetical protein
MLSNVSGFQQSTVTLVESPRQSSRMDDKLITKRIYKDGTAPHPTEKMSIIKQDIERLREKVIEKSPQPRTLQKSRSLTNFVSYSRGIIGDESIPEV